MDKETLSNYGWIVILVLILAVMLALASPFGSFIAGAIKSTTAGLFDVNQNALGSVGINVNDMVFENCDHLETEIRNVTDTYTGDTCCKNCGKVMVTGQTVRAKIPEGGVYYVGVTDFGWHKYETATAVYYPGDEFPELSSGDVYLYGDYEYRYNMFSVDGTNSYWWRTDETMNGWGVKARDEKRSYGYVLETINGKPIVSMSATFSYVDYDIQLPEDFTIPSTVNSVEEMFQYSDISVLPKNLVIPTGVTSLANIFEATCVIDASQLIIPDTVTNMEEAFYNCGSLKYAPKIPNSVTNMKYTFWNCCSLMDEGMPNIPTGVKELQNTFRNCKSLVDLSDYNIPSNVTNMNATFADCASLIKLPKIPNSVVEMSGTFSNCSSLTNISDFVIPSGVTTLNSLFAGCKSLTNDGLPVIPNTVTKLLYTFQNCTSLTDLSDYTIPNSVTDMMMAFSGCSSLTNEGMPTLPNNVSSLYGTFKGCTSLTDVGDYIIPSSVTSMSCIFENCTNLKVAPVLPEGLRSIDSGFKNCTSLINAPIIHRMTYSVANTFEGCTSLSGTVTINSNPQFYTKFIYNTQIEEIIGNTTMADRLLLTKTVTTNNPVA